MQFTTVKGKLHDGVKDVMGATGMLTKSVDVAKACRTLGAKVRERGRARVAAAPLLRRADRHMRVCDSCTWPPTACRRA